MDDSNGERQMFDATCADCGSETKVPFQPSGDRPVYCNDCFRKNRPQRSNGGGPRQMYDAVCATCGEATQVPFEPTQGRAVYCREHYKREAA